jgi:hypothetical protein
MVSLCALGLIVNGGEIGGPNGGAPTTTAEHKIRMNRHATRRKQLLIALPSTVDVETRSHLQQFTPMAHLLSSLVAA